MGALQRGYALQPKHVFEAQEQGAFLTNWEFLEIAPGGKKEFEVEWKALAAPADILKETNILFEKGVKGNNHVHARRIISYSLANDFDSPTLNHFVDFVDISKRAEKERKAKAEEQKQKKPVSPSVRSPKK